MTKSNKKKANSFAENLEKTFQPTEGEAKLEWENSIQEECKIKFATSKEITAEIKENIN